MEKLFHYVNTPNTVGQQNPYTLRSPFAYVYLNGLHYKTASKLSENSRQIVPTRSSKRPLKNNKVLFKKKLCRYSDLIFSTHISNSDIFQLLERHNNLVRELVNI